MTFTLPEELASKLAKRVPTHKRSRYVASAIAEKLAERDERLIRACEIANRDPELRKVEREFDAIRDEIPAAWEDALQEILELD